MRGNTLDSIYTTLIGGKTLLGYCFKALLLHRRVSKIPILPHLLFKPTAISIYIAYIKLYTYLSLTLPHIYTLFVVPLLTI